MDDQKLNQFLNEQSLINMSVIEQLNKQQEYLESIIERINIIYDALNGTGSTLPNIQGSNSMGNNRDNMINEDNQNDHFLMHSNSRKNNPLNINTNKAKGVYLKGTSPEEMQAKLEEKKSQMNDGELQEDNPSLENDESVDIEPAVIQNAAIEDEWLLEEAIHFGDRIHVITKTIEDTGVFIELDDHYLVWVVDGGRITFTDITGATIMRLT
jgi:hypothetical protein